MKYFKKTIDSRISQEVIICLNKIFGDSFSQISEKTGLSKKLIIDAIKGEDCLTAKHMRKISDSYQVPFSFILLKAVEERGRSAPKEMKSEYESVRDVLLTGAELEEEANKEYGKNYINWRTLI